MFETYMIVYVSDPLRLNNFKNIKENHIPELQMFKALDSINNYEEVVAIARKTKYFSEAFINNKLHSVMFKGKIGCKLSHSLLIEQFYEKSPHDWLLVLEDDVKVKQAYSKNFINTIITEATKNKSHFINLCMHPTFLEEQKKAPKKTEHLHKMVPQWWASAYLIDKYASKISIENPLPNEYNDTGHGKRIKEFNSLAYIDSLFENQGAKGRNDPDSKFGSLIWGFPSK